MDRQYKFVGLQTHPKKSFRDSTEATFWGAHVDGRSGLIRANPQRVIPMLAVVCRVIRIGYASISLLETVAGVFISVFSFRRRLFSLLTEIYKLPGGLDPKHVIPLSDALVDELVLCVCLAPLAVTNIRSSFCEELYMTDASNWGEAVVTAPVGEKLSREMLRHSLNKPAWTRLLTPFKSLQREEGVLDPSEELPDGEPCYTEHPLWETAARCLQFKLVAKRRAKSGRRINVGELRAFIMAEKDAASKGGDVRVGISSDSQVCLGAINKGRSASPALNHELQKSLPFCLRLGVYSFSGYTRTKYNPADDPTRGSEVRSPELEVPAWWIAAQRGDFAGMDAFLDACELLPEQVCGLPPVTELFPEVAVQNGSPFDKPKNQRHKAKLRC